MYKDVVFEVPAEQATRETKWVAMLQTNRGVTAKIAVGPTERIARERLNKAKAQQVEAILN